MHVHKWLKQQMAVWQKRQMQHQVQLRLQLADFHHGLQKLGPSRLLEDSGPFRKGKSNQESLQLQSSVSLLEGKWVKLQHHRIASLSLALASENVLTDSVVFVYISLGFKKKKAESLVSLLEMQFRSVDLTNQHVLCISKEKKRKLQITVQCYKSWNRNIHISFIPSGQ